MCNVANFLTTPACNEYSLMSIWTRNASIGIPGAAVSILGDVVYFTTRFVYCSSSALSTILVSARLCRYRCDVDVILTEGSRAAHALRMRLLTGIFFCRVKARVKSFLWLNPSVVFTCDQNVFQLSYTNDVVTWASLLFGVTIFFAHFQQNIQLRLWDTVIWASLFFRVTVFLDNFIQNIQKSLWDAVTWTVEMLVTWELCITYD